jgi:choline-phosphate cytidylyltransferase
MDSGRKRPSIKDNPSPEKKMKLGEDPNRPMRLYADGVFDMFHHGHMRLLEQCKKRFTYVYLIVGVSGDEETHRLKGKTVMNEAERAEAVAHCKWVDEVICPCPWTLTLEFLDLHQIDLVCHDEAPYPGNDGEDIYAPIKKAGRFLATLRTDGISTSDIILRIVRDYDEFVRRNLNRGYSRQDMNVSLMRSSTIKIKSGLKKIKEKVEKWTGKNDEGHPEDYSPRPQRTMTDRIDEFRGNIRDTFEKWTNKSEDFMHNFIETFERKSQTVEKFMKKAFHFNEPDNGAPKVEN